MQGGGMAPAGSVSLSSGLVPAFTGIAIVVRQETHGEVTEISAKVVGYGSYLNRTVSVEMPLDPPDNLSYLLTDNVREQLMLKVLNAAYEAMAVAIKNKENLEVLN